MKLTAQQAVEMLRASGEPTRLRILASLAREELAVMELSQILDQSQPRVSRHLKLLTEAGLVERFPDGAWMFYRLAAHGPRRQMLDQVLALIEEADPTVTRDAERLQTVRSERSDEASAYFARNAARWDELRSLYVSEADVEQAILVAAGQGPFQRLVDLGSGTGRMLTLLGPRADAAIGLDLSQQMLNIARDHTAEAGRLRRPGGGAPSAALSVRSRRRHRRGRAAGVAGRPVADGRLRPAPAGVPAPGPPAPPAGLFG